ncbi:MAG: sigma factor [Bacteroidota bacterium]
MSAPQPSAEAWRRARAGDRDAFEEALAPYHTDLRDAADRLLAVERDPVDGTPTDELPADITPEELMGEALLRAWDLRERYDADQMSFRAWLLGLQSRSLDRYVRRESRYARRKAISLDEELPTGEDQDAVQEQFYAFRQPFDVDTYAEIVAGSTAGGEPPLDADDLDRLGVAEAEARRAAVLHDEFELSLAEVAQILDASLKDTASMMNLAREGLRARIGSVDDAHDDDPTHDSYTGDPLPDA